MAETVLRRRSFAAERVSKPLRRGSDAEGCKEHILKFVAEVVIRRAEGIAALLYAKHQAKSLEGDDRLDRGNEHQPCELLGRVDLFLGRGDQALLDVVAHHRG